MSVLEHHRLRVTGRVQGVGFRYFTMTVARDLGVMGFVKNEVDGSVLCEVQGERERIERFVAAVREGPGYSRVDEVERERVDVEKMEQGVRFGEFEIR